jgi:hypothetical protein
MINSLKLVLCFRLIGVFMFFSNSIHGQVNTFLPIGKYQTFSDFISKRPTSSDSFVAKEIPTTPYFKIKNNDGKTERESFAFSDKFFYVHLQDLNQHLVNENWFILNDRASHYAKAIHINDSLLYFEINDISKSYAIIGIGISKLTGVVFQKSISKFRVLKTNQDVTDFLTQEKPELLEKYILIDDKSVEIDLIRKIITAIRKF